MPPLTAETPFMQRVWLIFSILACLSGQAFAAEPLTEAHFIEGLRPAKADARVAYGPGASQWADLSPPKGPGLFPVAIFTHGGCGGGDVPADTASQMAADLAAHGIAVWN